MQTGTRWFVVVVAIGLLLSRQLRPSIAVLVAGGTAWVSARVLKAWFDRPRPTVEELQRPLRELASGAGFPSSHTAVSAALMVVLVVVVAIRRPEWGRWPIVAATAVVVMTALGRVYVGAHWPLDTVGGAILGAFCGALSTAFVIRRNDSTDETTGTTRQRPPQKS